MAYYELSDKVVVNLLKILDSAVIRGADAPRMLEIYAVLGKQKTYFEFSDNQKEFLLGVVDNIQIPGRAAQQIVEILMILSKPLDKIPDQKPAKPVPPPKPPPPPPPNPGV